MDAEMPVEIRDEGTTDRYFHVMLNMADDELNPYEYRLLGHYRRVCGARNVPCIESTRTTAERCKMSAGQVSQTRRALAASGWIVLSGDRSRTSVTLVDRMPENVARYTARGTTKNCSPDEQASSPEDEAFTTRTNRSPDEQERSPGERKKELIKKEPSKEPAKTSSANDRGDRAGGEQVDDDRFIRNEAAAIGLSEDNCEKLIALGLDQAAGLLITAQRRAKTNPAGLLITMVRGGQPPAADDLALVPLALEMRTLEPDRLDREQRARRLKQAAEHGAQNGSEPVSAAPPDRAARDVWQQVLGQLRAQLNKATFETWLKGTTAETLADGVLTVRSKHAYGAGWCEKHLQQLVDQLASTAAGQAIRVVFEAPAWLARAGG